MEMIIFRMPKEYYNKLNNFYLENFNYDIYTQIQNFLSNELKNCESVSEEPPVEHPRPRITSCVEPPYTSKYRFVVNYPDNTTSQVYGNDYEKLLEIWNEWSKYGFSREYKDNVLLKIYPEKVKNINKKNGKYVLTKFKDNHQLKWGNYDSVEDAFEVKKFLVKNNWDAKYHSMNLTANIDNCDINNYSDYLLKIVKGEMEL